MLDAPNGLHEPGVCLQPLDHGEEASGGELATGAQRAGRTGAVLEGGAVLDDGAGEQVDADGRLAPAGVKLGQLPGDLQLLDGQDVLGGIHLLQQVGEIELLGYVIAGELHYVSLEQKGGQFQVVSVAS